MSGFLFFCWGDFGKGGEILVGFLGRGVIGEGGGGEVSGLVFVKKLGMIRLLSDDWARDGDIFSS